MKTYFVEWLHKNLKCEQTFDFSCDAPKFEGIKPRHVFAELSSISGVDMETIDDKIDSWYVGPI